MNRRGRMPRPRVAASAPVVVPGVAPGRRRDAPRYCRAMATRRRSSGSMKWSLSSSPTSICTQLILPVNRLRLRRVVGADGGAGLVADVGGLVGREDHRLGRADPSGADGVAVVVQRDVAALGETAAVVRELHAHLVRSLPGSARSACDRELLDAEHVVDELRRAVVDVHAPSAEPAALRDDHAARRRRRAPRPRP